MPARRFVLALACALLTLAATALAGCGTTPTLPLPPPVISALGPPSLQGLVRVEGEANEEAYVTVLNERLGAGKIEQADADGHFVVELEAQSGDRLLIWQERDGLTGERVERVVPAPAP